MHPCCLRRGTVKLVAGDASKVRPSSIRGLDHDILRETRLIKSSSWGLLINTTTTVLLLFDIYNVYLGSHLLFLMTRITKVTTLNIIDKFLKVRIIIHG